MIILNLGQFYSINISLNHYVEIGVFRECFGIKIVNNNCVVSIIIVILILIIQRV